MNSRPGFWFEIMRVTLIVAAWGLAPAGAIAGDGVPPSSGKVQSASVFVAIGFDAPSPLMHCANGAAADRTHCCQSHQGVPAAVLAPLRDGRELAPLFSPTAVILPEIPADMTIASARTSAPAFSRFILFGNYRG